MGPDLTERERRDRLAADLELLGKMGDPTRGPMARYYLPARSQEVFTARPAAPLAPWRHGLAVVLARVQRVRLQRPDLTWSLLMGRRHAKRLT